MTNSKTPAWHAVHTLEDLLALVNQIDERRRVIRVQSWHEGSWRSVYVEATAMKNELAQLQDLLRDTWADVYQIARSQE